jgi:hypothetical protein
MLKGKIQNVIKRNCCGLDSLAVGLGAGFACLGGPGEVGDGNDEEGVAGINLLG